MSDLIQIYKMVKELQEVDVVGVTFYLTKLPPAGIYCTLT